jgi:hypothetical protein
MPRAPPRAVHELSRDLTGGLKNNENEARE